MDINMNEVRKGIVEKKLVMNPTVGNGGYLDMNDKNVSNKQKCLSYLANGATKKAAAFRTGVTEMTFYNWCNADPKFKAMADAALGGEDELIALYNVSQGVRKGDPEMTKYLLNKRKTYERRFDQKLMDEKSRELIKNPATGVFEPMESDSVIAGLMGELGAFGDDYHSEDTSLVNMDSLERALYEGDDMVN
jgi:hypothetical protein